jgi:hypothetical protein
MKTPFVVFQGLALSLAVSLLSVLLITAPASQASIGGGWGANSSGQCDLPTGLPDVVAFAGGIHHSVALKADGTLVTWGSSEFRQRDVPAGLTNVAALAVGP